MAVRIDLAAGSIPIESVDAIPPEGRYIFRPELAPQVHQCNPPGWWRRREDRVIYGTIWECRCGQLWRWEQPWTRYEPSTGPDDPGPI